ncbi:hypothetical protein DL768_011186 [Monosporascus sp. mg162]|nr:hypothetical protein DL768_011186 [Monosporascus sp. mg162]
MKSALRQRKQVCWTLKATTLGHARYLSIFSSKTKSSIPSSRVVPAFGFQTLYDPGSAVVDIIFVHGLTGHREKTWTHKEASDPWPKTLLPKRIPQARIMTFGYDANVTDWVKIAGANRIGDHSRSLLVNLANFREVDFTALIGARNNAERHIQKVLRSTRGLMFLGTPHSGADLLAAVATKVARVAGIVKQVNVDILQVLKNDSEVLARIQDDFHNMLRLDDSIKITCCFEELAVPVTGMVVPKHSAILPGYASFGIHANHMNMTKFKDENDQGFPELVHALQRLVNEIKGSQNNLLSVNEIYSVPRNPSGLFTGREQLIRKLEESFPSPHEDDERRCVVLHGLGGSGKTQIALKFAEAFRHRYWGVFWVDVSSQKAAEQGFKEISRIGNVGENTVSAKHWLSNVGKPWLLVIDGADDPDRDVEQYVPAASYGHILITSRNPHCGWDLRSAMHEIQAMEVEEAKELLLRASSVTDRSEENTEAAGNIVRALGASPLALIQAAGAIRQNICTLGTYLDDFSRHRKELLRHPGHAVASYKENVYTTWDLSFNKIERMQTRDAINAVEMMKVFAFLHWDSVPITIFERAWKNRSSQSESQRQPSGALGVLSQTPSQWDSFPVRKGLRILATHSLIDQETEGKDISTDPPMHRVSMHRLVHQWAQDRLPPTERQRFLDIATSLLAESISLENDDDSSSYRKVLMPHVDYCLRLDGNEDRWFRADYSEHWQLDYGRKFASVYSEFGRLREAEKIQLRVMRGCRELLGGGDRETLKATADLANTFRRQGVLDKAKELQSEVLGSMQSVLGARDPDTLTVKCELADTYRDQGHWREAEALERQVMEERKDVLGPDHPDTLKTMADLALIYRRLGNFKEAKIIQEEVLESRKKILGDFNKDTLKVKGQLADTYRDQGLWDDAERLEEQVIEALEKVLPKSHPHMLIAIAKGDLAASYLGQKRWNEAERVLEQVVMDMDRVLGSKHPHKLKMAAKLAVSYRAQGRLDDAETLLLEVIKEMEELKGVLAKDHPDILRAKGYLADTYRCMNRLDDAEELGEEVLESAKRVMGESHPYTREIALGLADTYRRKEMLDDADALGVKATEAGEV